MGQGLLCPINNLSTDEISTIADNLKVYPNPVHENLTISFDQKILSVTVYSVAGHKMINNIKGTVDMSALISGVYIVKVNAADKTEKTGKVIKR